MSKQKTWLWPDHTISKRESRELREEHNKLVNCHVELLEALKECITENGSLAYASEDFYRAKQRLMAVTNIARDAIAKATE